MIVVAVGYLASFFLAVSLVVKKSLSFRWYNILGCVSFIIYGSLISAFPVILANTILLIINIVQLIKLLQKKEKFDLIDISSHQELVDKFIAYYKDDFEAYYPNANKNVTGQSVFAFAVLRELSIANLFIATVNEAGCATVEINYTVPQFRDFKVGKFIFEENKSYLIQRGITSIIYQKTVHKGHHEFLMRMGFEAGNTSTNWTYKKIIK